MVYVRECNNLADRKKIKGVFVEGPGTKAVQQLPFIDYKKPVGNHCNYSFIKCRLHGLEAKHDDSHVSRAEMRM